ncbi:MAG TPA: tripartite tricarboxylate transporter permease [Acidobacteriota bacterium]|nr:tripartite tricarboxylate transporter permease [Acidobacteriota bacterium]
MFIEILIALLLGVTAGTLTGLTPGLHLNLASAIVVSIFPILAVALPSITAIHIVCCIVSLATTHTIIDTLPSVFLGAPSEENIASAVPAHQQMLRGNGLYAVFCIVSGSYLSFLLTFLCAPVLLLIMKHTQTIIQPAIGLMLLIIITQFFACEQKEKRVAIIGVWLLSGCLGILTLAYPKLRQPLLALLSGLFGIPTLVENIVANAQPPAQKPHDTEISASQIKQSTVIATIAGFCAGFLPGLGSSQVSIISNKFAQNAEKNGKNKQDQTLQLMTSGGINTVSMLVSCIAILAIHKARNGAIVSILDIVPTPTTQLVTLLFVCSLIAASVSTYLAVSLAKYIPALVAKVSYALVSKCILAFIVVLVLYFDGLVGMIILMTASALGTAVLKIGCQKQYLLGSLLIPVLAFFLL